MTNQSWSSLTRRRAVPSVLFAAAGAAGLLLGRDRSAALLFLGCALATWLLVPRIARWALRHRILALPGGRDQHGRRTPRAGGIALFVPIAITLSVLAVLDDARNWGLLVGATIAFGCGLVDDVRRMRPLPKIVCQLAAGTALVLAGFRLPELVVPGLGSFSLGVAEVPVILFWVVLVTNAVNLSDGLDGLASSLTMLGLAVLVAGGVGSLVPIALAGTCFGFLHYNMPKARIFLGDSGSLLLGFLLAALSLQLPAVRNVPLALAACAYPLGDVAVSVTRRFIRSKPIFSADGSHVHHKAVQYFGTQRRGLAVVLAFATLHAVFGVLWPGAVSLMLSALFWFFAVAMLTRRGNYHAGEVMGQRRPMRRLHALQRYVGLRIKRAEDRAEVERALLHFVEGARLCSVTVRGSQVVNREGCCVEAQGDAHPGRPCEHHTIRMKVGRAAWRGPEVTSGSVLGRERETIVIRVLRNAAEKLAEFPPVPDDAGEIDITEQGVALR